MLAKVNSCAIIGLDGALVEVEVYIAQGLPNITIVGLPDTAVQESRERVRAAIKNSGFYFPGGRLTINLAPADLRKEGPAYDLPIAVGVLLATEQVIANLDDAIIMGELSLDGGLRHVSGVLPLAGLAARQGYHRLFVPAVDAPEAAVVPDLEVYPVESLLQLFDHLCGHAAIKSYESHFELGEYQPAAYASDMAEIKGQEHVKRALEVAASGGHNMLMVGPPGSGKTLIARSMPAILPPLTLDEALDITRIYSVADMLTAGEPLIKRRPFRAPHHTISYAGLIGGGRLPKPGEISLAHRGVLFLDELPEFGSRMLEMLRQPLEDKTVSISRSAGSLTYPANFTLIAAMNPCPCGYYGDPSHECTCSPMAISRYQQRISGPLLDRMDIHVEVPRVDIEKLSDDRRGESSAAIRERVEKARVKQQERFAGYSADGRNAEFTCNADMGPAEVRRFCKVDEVCKGLLRSASQQFGLSARGYHRVLKIARTIADLAGSPEIQVAHIAEAIQYRPKRLR